jgi:FtsP/CotA-like multicopper oxidase with cupredoxin domain
MSRTPVTPPRRQLTRRDMLERGMGSFALLCAFQPGLKRSAAKTTTSAAMRSAQRAALAPFEAELRLPPELVPVSSSATEDVFRVAIREGEAEIMPGTPTPIYGYEGVFPGPTIRARKGRSTVVTVENQVSFDQNVHLHGGLTPEVSDGGPHQLIAPGGSYTYRYTGVQDGATLWYHDHAHGLSARSLYYGLAGFYLLEDDVEAALELPGGEFELPLMIQDRAFNADGSLRYTADLDQGLMGDTIVVNGTVSPRTPVKRALYRLRLLNASNAREYRLELAGGEELIQIGGDGGLLERPVRRTSLPLAPAERADVLVDFSRFRAGQQLILTNGLSSGSTGLVMRFDVTGRSTSAGRVPRALRPAEAIPAPAADRRWELTFSSDAIQWQIGGQGFDMERVDARPRLGTTERWQFVNTSHRPHPMHLHGVHFRVLSRSGGSVNPGDQGWKDTVQVRTGETVTVQPAFAPYAGRYVFHCHNLEHQDQAMMGQMEIES